MERIKDRLARNELVLVLSSGRLLHHNLLANDPPEKVTKIYSKPEALAQCRKWLAVQMLHAQKIPAASTSKAAEIAAGEPGSAAIGSTLAGEVYGLKVQFQNIEDNPRNTTRFFVIGKHAPKPSGDDKTSIRQRVAQASAKTGENIQISRFVRFRVGEGND